MAKFLLVTILLASLVIPLSTATHPDPRMALRRALLGSLGFILTYGAVLRVVYPRLQ